MGLLQILQQPHKLYVICQPVGRPEPGLDAADLVAVTNHVGAKGEPVFRPIEAAYRKCFVARNLQELRLCPPPLFWNTEHMFVVVGGRDWGMCYLGGGDHGGPICKAAALPENFTQLATEYRQELGHVDY